MAEASDQPEVTNRLRPAQLHGRKGTIPAPNHQSFISHFGDAFPHPVFLESDLGSTAVYDIPAPPSAGNGTAAQTRNVVILHGINTPALGMWPLAKDIQAIEPNTNVVLFDMWGHGLSSTPLVAHTRHIFHHQIMQVLLFKAWSTAHMIGFSFGGVTAVSFSVQNPWLVESVVLMGPAGLLDENLFGADLKRVLAHPEDNGPAAQDCVLDWLEGGPLLLPDDWKEKSQKGQVVAPAFRKWELDEHAGYKASVLSMFREVAAPREDELFRRFVKQSFKKAAVLGGMDPICGKDQLIQVGFDPDDIAVIANADHAFVRDRSFEVAEAVGHFWRR